MDKNSNQKCPKGKELKCAESDGPVHNHNNPDCFANTAEQYWFYLAFENSICNDYITEKFWRTLDLKTVPVVMGGGNYLRDAPEKVFCSYTKHSKVFQSNRLNKVNVRFMSFGQSVECQI